MPGKWVTHAVFGLQAMTASVVMAHEPIVVHYTVRPPYTEVGTDSQRLEGLAGARLIEVLRRASIPYRLHVSAPLRQLDALKENKGRDCTYDWYKTPERTRYARFSNPFAQDSPYVFVTHRTLEPKQPVTLAHLINSNLVLARVEGYAYGEYIDSLILEGKIKSVITHGEEIELLALIKRRRADFALMLDAEMSYILQHHEKFRSEIRVYELSDRPDPEFTYFLCSFKVDPQTMQAFNNALAEMPFAQY